MAGYQGESMALLTDAEKRPTINGQMDRIEKSLALLHEAMGRATEQLSLVTRSAPSMTDSKSIGEGTPEGSSPLFVKLRSYSFEIERIADELNNLMDHVDLS